MSQEMDALISRYLDEDLTTEEQDRLSDWIKADDNHASQFAKRVMLHDRLFDLSRSGLQSASDTIASSERNASETKGRTEPAGNRRYGILAVIAASLILMVGYGYWQQDRGQSVVELPSEKPFVTVTQVVAKGQELKWNRGDRLANESLVFTDGLVRLHFDDGVEVTIEGPVNYKLIAPGHTRLDSGRLAAIVPSGAEGFRVDTPSAEVIDLGTAFGIELSDSGDTSVSVFDGEVEVGLPESQSRQTLTEGQAVRIQAGNPIESVEFDMAPFERIWPVASGIESTQGEFQLLPPWPRRIRFVRSDTTIFVQPEGYSVRLSQPLAVNISQPGDYSQEGQLTTSEVASGSNVRSFVLHYHPEETTRKRRTDRITGSITFDCPVVGLIVLQEELMASRKQLSLRNSGESHARRQLEFSGGPLGDTVSLSADRRTVELTLASPGRSSDLLRIVVDAASDDDG